MVFIFIRADLLFYYKQMSIYLLANQCTPLSMVSRSKIVIYRVILYLNNKIILSKNIKVNKK